MRLLGVGERVRGQQVFLGKAGACAAPPSIYQRLVAALLASDCGGNTH